MKLFKQEDQVIVYCESSKTLRLMPNNYCIAVNQFNNEWVMFPDSALPLNVVLLVTTALMVYEIKWHGNRPLKLLAAVTGNDVTEFLTDLSMMHYTEKLANKVVN